MRSTGTRKGSPSRTKAYPATNVECEVLVPEMVAPASRKLIRPVIWNATYGGTRTITIISTNIITSTSTSSTSINLRDHFNTSAIPCANHGTITGPKEIRTKDDFVLPSGIHQSSRNFMPAICFIRFLKLPGSQSPLCQPASQTRAPAQQPAGPPQR